MADERDIDDKESPEGAGGAKRSAGVVAWALVILGSLVAGFLSPLVYYHFVADGEPGGIGSTQVANPDAPPAFVPYGEVVVNLNESRLNRYLRVNISLMVDQKHANEVNAEVERRRTMLHSWLLGYLADKEMEEVRGAAGQNRLRREIQFQFNQLLFANRQPLIRGVLFEEFNVQ